MCRIIIGVNTSLIVGAPEILRVMTHKRRHSKEVEGGSSTRACKKSPLVSTFCATVLPLFV